MRRAPSVLQAKPAARQSMSRLSRISEVEVQSLSLLEIQELHVVMLSFACLGSLCLYKLCLMSPQDGDIIISLKTLKPINF